MLKSTAAHVPRSIQGLGAGLQVRRGGEGRGKEDQAKAWGCQGSLQIPRTVLPQLEPGWWVQ